ncbi:MAG: tRNA epoxyqueuosine(34) reductase QueG [bacterium]|nr:tRNA epoxyqueuosine(34) reductase QueG [bacterium]
MKRDLSKQLNDVAQEAGFDCLGIIGVDEVADLRSALEHFVLDGRHGNMDWLCDHLERRAHPTGLWSDVRSVIMLGMNYGPDSDPLAGLDQKSNGVISVYAKGKDYHSIINKRLKRVAGWLVQMTGEQVKVFVDTAPVTEKPLAASAGLGWQGKHTNIVSRDYGSWLFLGAIFTTVELASSEAGGDHCGGCERCLDICPTEALIAPYQLDARRCISYLTIEYKGHIERDLREKMGNHIFGCDDCLAVCPWNKFAKLASEQRFHPRAQCDNSPLQELLILDDAAFRERFKGTPIKRAGRDCFVRNVLIACGNSGDVGLVGDIQPLLEDDEPVVRAMAVWALSQLMEAGAFESLKKRVMLKENDADVVNEWERRK